MTYDVLFLNAKIVDGAGTPWYRGDVAVKDGKIAEIGALAGARAKEVADVAGRVLCPGFIDVHTHSDFVIFRDPVMREKLAQGVTTQLLGQCGESAAPVKDKYLDLLITYMGFVMAGADVKWTWHSFDEWLCEVEKLKLAGNVAPCVGHGTIRVAVMGFEDRPADAKELAEMKDLLREAMDAGCYGMSSGLIYPPGVFTPALEIQELASVLSETGGIYFSHMRNESGGLLQSVEEILELGRRAKIPVQISHHKALGRDNWGMVTKSLKMVDEARAEGVDVTIDQYPYRRCSTSVRACLPPWVQEGGVPSICKRLEDPEIRAKVTKEIEESLDMSKPCSWESMMRHAGGPAGGLVIYCPATPQWEGRNLREIADAMGKTPIEAAYDIIMANNGNDLACYDTIDEADLKTVLAHPATMIGSDSIPASPGGKAHPRSYGTNPRILGKYVREEKTLSLETAVYKMTGLPSSRLGLQHKGLVREGMDADLVVFDPATVRDRGTYDNPSLPPLGIDSVYVAGQKVIDMGEYTGATPGKVLRRNR